MVLAKVLVSARVSAGDLVKACKDAGAPDRLRTAMRIAVGIQSIQALLPTVEPGAVVCGGDITTGDIDRLGNLSGLLNRAGVKLP